MWNPFMMFWFGLTWLDASEFDALVAKMSIGLERIQDPHVN
jgi:hypothetical protein